MKFENQIDPRHGDVQRILRGIGPAVAGVGLVLTAVGMIDFFRSFGTFEFPRYFWCAFLGLPLLSVGIGISKFGYLGAILRYFAGEAAPVQKEAFNYLAEGTRPGVETLAQAVGQGFAAGARGGPSALEPICPRCQAPSRESSQFCNQCGAAIGDRACGSCGRRNDPAAKFCDQCGDRLD